MNRPTNSALVWFWILFAISFGMEALSASENLRYVSVRGEAEVKVVPDMASIVLGADTWNKDLDAAKKENDDRIRKIMNVLSTHHISAGDIQTGYIRVEPMYDTRYDHETNPASRKLIGYRVEKTMAITLKDLSKFDEILGAIQKGGANVVDGIEFRTTDLRKYRDQARSMAMRAAKEKAEALTKEIGQKIGKAVSISEDNGSYWGGYSRGSRNSMMNATQNSSGGDSSGGTGDSTVSPGKISVSAGVSVSFLLE